VYKRQIRDIYWNENTAVIIKKNYSINVLKNDYINEEEYENHCIHFNIPFYGNKIPELLYMVRDYMWKNNIQEKNLIRDLKKLF